MKIGIFDSGLGGLIVTRSLIEALPEYDYLYLGDTARVPYGNRSQETVYRFTEQAVDYLLSQDCGLVIIACNTASAEALRQIQQQFLPKHFPDRRILGVLIPGAEVAIESRPRSIGILATLSTVNSGVYPAEIKKLLPEIEIIQSAAPLLVPLVENNGAEWAEPIITEYLRPISGCDSLILGCTHYPYFKDQIRKLTPARVISLDEVLPAKLADYLARHTEIDRTLSQQSQYRFEVTDLTENIVDLAADLFGRPIELHPVGLE